MQICNICIIQESTLSDDGCWDQDCAYSWPVVKFPMWLSNSPHLPISWSIHSLFQIAVLMLLPKLQAGVAEADAVILRIPLDSLAANDADAQV